MKPLLLLILLLVAVSVGPMNATAAPTSVVQIPFQIPLQGLLKEAEKQVPLQAGHWHEWQRRYGVDTRYRAWRGPLAMDFSGDVLTVQAHVRYWVQVRKDLIAGFEVAGQCGVKEPPRQAVIGLQVRFAWNPDWTLRPLFRLMPTRFIDRCEMTAAGIDVTPLVGEAFQQQMKENLAHALRELVPRMQALRQRAVRAWSALNRPVDLGGGYWLSFHPLGAALSPLYGRDSRANGHLALVLQPELSVGRQPAHDPALLPPLQPVYPPPGPMRFDMTLRLDYEQVGARLLSTLRQQKIQVKDHRIGIGGLRLSGANGELYARLELTGDAEGAAELWASVGFDAASQSFAVTTLDYVFDPRNPDIYALATLFYERIRQAMVEGANELLQAESARLAERLRQAMAEALPGASAVRLDGLALRDVNLAFDADGIRFEGSASGAVNIDL